MYDTRATDVGSAAVNRLNEYATLVNTDLKLTYDDCKLF